MYRTPDFLRPDLAVTRRHLHSIIWPLLLALLTLWGFGSTAEAGSATVGGKRMTCRAADVVMDASLPGPGFAFPGVVRLNPRMLARYSSATQRIIFLHECAHQYVGPDERAADCWAVKMAKRQGWFGPRQLEEVCKAVWQTPPGMMHMAGPHRCEALRQCFNASKQQRTATQTARGTR